MARRGVASRRRCEDLIREGRVTVNGRAALIGSTVSPQDRICLDKKPLRPEERKIYMVVNKPQGFLCSNEDKEGRPLVKDLIKRVPSRIFHVGRLDFLSTGLIFYTNDGHFARKVSHPFANVEKEYSMESSETIPENILKQYKSGITIENQRYQVKQYRYKTPKKVLITLIEGKNREIRRVFEAFKLPIKRIHRVRIGCVTDKNLPIGRYRHLSLAEVQWFLKRAGE